MNIKEVNLYFTNCFASFGVELHESGSFSIRLTEFQENEGKSDNKHSYLEPRHTTEVFVGSDEIKSMINALQFLLKEDDEWFNG